MEGDSSRLRVRGVGDEDFFVDAFGPAPVDAISALEEIVATKEPVLVVIDTMQRLTRIKDVSDYAQVTAGLEPLLNLARSGPCVVMTHHDRKSAGDIAQDSLLGSTAIAGTVDTMMHISRDGDARRYLSTTQRALPDLPRTELIRGANGKMRLGEGRAQVIAGQQRNTARERVVAFLARKGGATLGEIKEAGLGTRRAAIVEALKAAEACGEIVRAGAGVKGDPTRFSVPHSQSLGGERRNGIVNEAATVRVHGGFRDSDFVPDERADAVDDEFGNGIW